MGDNPFSNRKGHAESLLPGAAHANDNSDRGLIRDIS
jgi:hypothetical protein